MAHPLMPMATAVWLVENTALTFEQISDFCGLHPLEVQAIADGEVAVGIKALDPVQSGQIEPGEIERCLADPSARLSLRKHVEAPPPKTRRGGRYTPVTKRQDKPDAILFLVRRHPDLADAQISRLLGTTKATIKAVREGTHKESTRLTPRDPVLLGLCSAAELAAELARLKPKVVKAAPPAPTAEAPPPEPAQAAAATIEQASAPRESSA
ncbi:MAG: cell cycle transcriptional regulator TrcR [Alphaproteobacteria bacterium]